MTNILIPIAGLGSRFPVDIYKTTKPLIKINGISMIEHAINSLSIKGKYNFVVRDNIFFDELYSTLKNIEPTCNIIKIDKLTNGPAETCLMAKDFINNDEELIIANSDQIMWWDSDLFLQVARNSKYDGVIVTYTANTDKNSYAKINKNGLVLEIKEKEVISDISLNGIHYWKHGKDFVDSANKMILNNERYNGEFYVGPTYNSMIKDGKKIGIYHIPSFQHNAVGVPSDLELYMEKLWKLEE
jgi:dTDP-glucose pyrophosphorylase